MKSFRADARRFRPDARAISKMWAQLRIFHPLSRIASTCSIAKNAFIQQFLGVQENHLFEPFPLWIGSGKCVPIRYSPSPAAPSNASKTACASTSPSTKPHRPHTGPLSERSSIPPTISRRPSSKTMQIRSRCQCAQCRTAITKARSRYLSSADSRKDQNPHERSRSVIQRIKSPVPLESPLH